MSRSEELLNRASRRIPGGVNSPVRAFGAVGGTPPFIAAAHGAVVRDVDGREYIDFVGSWGPMILGHAHPRVVAAVQQQMALGASYGAPTELEVQLAEAVCARMPAIEMLRMVNSGTEATMSAIRLARGVTGRDRVIKFSGCYHGHADHLLIEAGSGALTFGSPSSPGVPADFARHTLSLPYNDLAAVEQAFAGAEPVAAVIVEPVAGNMNCVPPVEGFLQGLRRLCDAHGSVLIFDEVMTGFRVHHGGAQALYGIRPDLTTLGKILGGGLPVGAFGGRRDLMQELAPAGPVYQAGTLSGNPLAMAAGLATLAELDAPGVYEQLDASCARLCEGFAALPGLPRATARVGGMFGWFIGCDRAPRDLEAARALDGELFARFFHGMLDAGVYLAPSAFEAGFVSLAHDDALIDRSLDAAAQVLHQLAI